MAIRLLDGVTVDTTGATFDLAPPQGKWQDQLYSVFVWSSDFGGGTVRIQVTPDGTNWFTARTINDNQAIFTVSDHMIVHLRSQLVRATLTGSTSPAALSVWVMNEWA